eukprot:TRINITY_DN3000_c0_g2_i1.p1 TRINITY_DN3000_c0_g2~~TRINITY_DN3000_c0_g2_i1.p1  ORF type:complete len:673 (-),score=131.26 TRINITY_DN3000_c0_g2_i1:80-2017(-)
MTATEQGGGGSRRRRGKRGTNNPQRPPMREVREVPDTVQEGYRDIVTPTHPGPPPRIPSAGKGSPKDAVHHHPPKEMAMHVGYPVRGGQTLLIAYFPWEATEADIEREFAKFCQVKRVHLVVDKSSKKPRCFGFVKFVTKGDAEEALRATSRGLVVLPDSRGHQWHLKAEWTKSGDMVVDDSETEQEVAKRKEERSGHGKGHDNEELWNCQRNGRQSILVPPPLPPLQRGGGIPVGHAQHYNGGGMPAAGMQHHHGQQVLSQHHGLPQQGMYGVQPQQQQQHGLPMYGGQMPLGPSLGDAPGLGMTGAVPAGYAPSAHQPPYAAQQPYGALGPSPQLQGSSYSGAPAGYAQPQHGYPPMPQGFSSQSQVPPSQGYAPPPGYPPPGAAGYSASAPPGYAGAHGGYAQGSYGYMPQQNLAQGGLLQQAHPAAPPPGVLPYAYSTGPGTASNATARGASAGLVASLGVVNANSVMAPAPVQQEVAVCAGTVASTQGDAVPAASMVPAQQSRTSNETQYLDMVWSMSEISLHDKNLPAPPAQQPPAPPANLSSPATLPSQWQTAPAGNGNTSSSNKVPQSLVPTSDASGGVEGTGSWKAEPHQAGGRPASATVWNSFDDAAAQGMVDGLVGGEEGAGANNAAWAAARQS